MTHIPLISIIVPVYKVELYVEDCIKSVLRQSFEDFELILVDDGSPDECPRICDKWQRIDTRVKVIHKENGGLSDARNSGIRAAIGKYIWCIDGDDWINENALAIIRDVTELFPEAKVLSTPIMEVRNGKQSLYGNGSYPLSPIQMTNEDYACHYPVLPSVRYIIKREVYDVHGLAFINGILHEDIPFCHMLMYLANKIALIPRPLYMYRIRDNSITTTPTMKSCYSLLYSYKQLRLFIEEHTECKSERWFMELLYDYFYEMFLRIKPFYGQECYKKFMDENSQYIRKEFNRLRDVVSGKRKLLLLIFNLSPLWYSRLINLKRNN